MERTYVESAQKTDRERLKLKEEFREADGTYKHTAIAWWSRKLKLGYAQLHAACGNLGLDKISNDTDLRRVVQYFQMRAVPFHVLEEIYNPSVPLAALAFKEVRP